MLLEPIVEDTDAWFAAMHRYADVPSMDDVLLLDTNAAVAVLAFDGDDATAAGALRAALEAASTPIGPYDVLIAAHALQVGATLVTANVGEFARVPGLAWEDWTADA